MRGSALPGRLCLCVLGLLVTLRPVHAEEPFRASTITPAGTAPSEGAVFSYTIVLRNTGPTAGCAVEIHLPSAALLVGIDGLEQAVVDHDARAIRWEGPIAPGASRVSTLSLVAGTDAGGHTASVRLTARPWQGEVTYLTHSAAVDTVPTPAVFTLGRFGVSAAGVAVLGWLAAGLLFWVVMGVVRPRDAAWAPIVIMLPVGFLLYFAALARDDLRILALPETTCTILDRVVDSRTGSSSTSRQAKPSTVYAPRLAMRSAEGEGKRVVQGFGTDSRLSGASASRAAALLDRYSVGSQVPCAIDPAYPGVGYVERGFGGAYFFALIPMPLLALGVWGLWPGRRR
jgi:hypothetical protein